MIITVMLLTRGVGFVQAQCKVVGYIPNYQNAAVDFEKVTHVNLAFENPDDQGNLSFSAANNAYIRKAHEHRVKVLISIGGGYASEDTLIQKRYFNLIGENNRDAFVHKICEYLQVHGADGLDVDLEGSAINSDYGAFIKSLSAELRPRGKLLTAALSHANGADKVSADVFPYFDFINIMAYDSTGPWKPAIPGQHSSFEFAKECLQYWVNRGLPKSKTILGVPFYGYGFGEDFNHGMSYGQIIDTYTGAAEKDIAGNTIYYNGVATMKKKVQHVVDNGYGGIMIWQLAQDAVGSKSMLLVIDRVLKGNTKK